MKLTQTKINEIVLEILGKDGLRLVKELKDRENVSEFSLATRLKRDIKQIRNMLYKLYNYNLVTSTRKKDKQKGWYIYYWTFLPENLKFLYLKNKKLLLQRLKEQLQKEQVEQFYTCPKKCVRLDFDQSLNLEFHCPECGELISQDIDPSRLTELQKRINSLEKELKAEEKIIPKRIIKKKPKKKKAKKKTTKKKKLKIKPKKTTFVKKIKKKLSLKKTKRKK